MDRDEKEIEAKREAIVVREPQDSIYRLCVELIQAWDAMQAANELAESDDFYGSTPEMEASINAIRNHKVVRECYSEGIR